MATASGVNAILYMGATNASEVTETFNLSIEVSTDTVEDTAHGDVWRTFIPTLSTFDMTIEKHFDTAYHVLQDAVINRTVMKFYLYPRRTDSTIYWYGTAYLTGGGQTLGLEDIINESYGIAPVAQPTYVHP